MDHEFVYPIVRPLPPRAIDVPPAAWQPAEPIGGPAATGATVHAIVGPVGAAPGMNEHGLSSVSQIW